MKKLVTIFLILASYTYAQTNFNIKKTKIVGIDKNIAIVNNLSNIDVGVSGIVLRNFEKGHKTIISAVEVIKKEGGKLYLKLTKFNGLKQDILPTYDIQPKVGDDVILNYHYNRALAITPDKKTYEDITSKYQHFDWVHPDIFATTLATSFKPAPTKETFQNECNTDSIGLLIFAIKDKAYFVDCKSFKVINQVTITPSTTTMSPFYTRIDGIKGRLFGLFGGKNIKDYNSYYSKLLSK